MAERVRFGDVTLHHGDCRAILPTLPPNSIEAVVCDPPYDLPGGFMSKEWDRTGVAFQAETWRAVSRVMKPGAHLVAFGGTKTWHRLACAIEDAGFELRDTCMWVYGTGFPKSLNVSKAIDRMAGAEGQYGEPKSAAHAGWLDRGRMRAGEGHDGWQRPWMDDPAALDKAARQYVPAMPEAAKWEGFGTALKPSWEPALIFRKPLSEPTVAANVLRWGTGALNIDGCRIEAPAGDRASYGLDGDEGSPTLQVYGERARVPYERSAGGRWPANLAHDGSPEVLAAFDLFGQSSGGRLRVNQADEVTGAGVHEGYKRPGRSSYTHKVAGTVRDHGDTGSAARFFQSCPLSPEELRFHYSAKAGKADRAGSAHPTVKPLSLMRWLVRMVTPPGGTVLDCFAGSGTTGCAAVAEGFQSVLIEQDAGYCDDIRRRLGGASGTDTPLFAQPAA
jgi:site-specific DNA-methyltransferase (adenine-specific)